METQTDNHCWKLRPDVVATVLNEGAVMLDLESKFFFSANPSAWAIAEMFEVGATKDEVYKACEQWGATPEHKAAIDGIIQLMASEGLIKPAEGAGAGMATAGVKTWILPTLTKHQEPLQRVMVSAFDPGLPLAE